MSTHCITVLNMSNSPSIGEINCKILVALMKEDDFGFASLKMEVLRRESIETVKQLMTQWQDLKGKAEIIASDFPVVKRSYLYLFCLGRYLAWLANSNTGVDHTIVDVWFERDDFHYIYIQELFTKNCL